jgi:hypothetical protein
LAESALRAKLQSAGIDDHYRKVVSKGAVNANTPRRILKATSGPFLKPRKMLIPQAGAVC